MYKRNFLVGLFSIILLVGFKVGRVQAPQIPQEPWQTIITQNNTVQELHIQSSIPLVYGMLLDCIQYYESEVCEIQNKEICIGKYGEKGCLQFLPKTFREFCIDRYKLAQSLDEIYDCDIQRKCADYMLREKFNRIYLWSTAKRCVK